MAAFETVTERVYLNDTYLASYTTKLLSIETLEAGSPFATKYGSNYKIALQGTIFHPQGGGQPSDIGHIYQLSHLPETEENGKNLLFIVKFVQQQAGNKNIVDHFGTFAEEVSVDSLEQLLSASIAVDVLCEIDLNRRIYHSRLHSAGHTIDAAMKLLGYADQLKPTKGYHFHDGPFVEYDAASCASLSSESQLDSLQQQLNETLKQIIEQAIPTKVNNMLRETAEVVCNSNFSGYPDEVRVVEIADTPCPCGGTHVNNTAELGSINVQKLKKKKNVLKVSYTIEHIN